MRITERDLDMLYQVWRFRFLRSDQVTRIVKGSEQGIIRRLGLLYHHGYLTRPPAQRRFYERGLNVPLVYGISKTGHAALAEASRLPQGAPANSSIRGGGLFLEHTLEVAEIVIGFEAKCRQSGRVLSKEEVFRNAPDEAIKPVGAFKWAAEVLDLGKRRTLTVIPDAVVGVEECGDPNQRVIYLIEVDRGTMPVSRRNLYQTSLRRKLIAYHETWRQGILRDKFGWRRWRTLTVTSSKKRRETLEKETRNVSGNGGTGIFMLKNFSPPQYAAKTIEEAECLPCRSRAGNSPGEGHCRRCRNSDSA